MLFTTSTRVMAQSRETTGLFGNGQHAFSVIKKDLDKGFMAKLFEGRTGVEASFLDPINGHVTLSIGARKQFKTEATVQDTSGGILAIIRWDELGQDDWLGGGTRSGDGSGTDVGRVHVVY